MRFITILIAASILNVFAFASMSHAQTSSFETQNPGEDHETLTFELPASIDPSLVKIVNTTQESSPETYEEIDSPDEEHEYRVDIVEDAGVRKFTVTFGTNQDKDDKYKISIKRKSGSTPTPSNVEWSDEDTTNN